MKNIFYAIKIFLAIPKTDTQYPAWLDLNNDYRCFLHRKDNILSNTLSFRKLGIDSHKKIDLNCGKTFIFKEILQHLKTMR